MINSFCFEEFLFLRFILNIMNRNFCFMLQSIIYKKADYEIQISFESEIVSMWCLVERITSLRFDKLSNPKYMRVRTSSSLDLLGSMNNSEFWDIDSIRTVMWKFEALEICLEHVTNEFVLSAPELKIDI